MRVKQLIAAKDERCFAVVFDPGEDAPAKLLEFAASYDVAAATFTGIGAFSSATLGFFERDKQDYHRIAFDEQVEVVSLIGNFAVEGDQPRLHCHAVIANRKAQAFGGHLLAGRVEPTLEVVVVDTPAYLRRKIDGATGLPLLVP